MDKRLRLLILATALALAPQAGYNTPFAALFGVLAIFFVPTSLVLTGAIVYLIRANWRDHPGFLLLAILNFILAASAVWQFLRFI